MTVRNQVIVGHFVLGVSALGVLAVAGTADAQRSRETGHAAVTVAAVGGGRTESEAELATSSAPTLLARCASAGRAVTATDAARVALAIDAEGQVTASAVADDVAVSTGATARWERCVVRALGRLEFPPGQVGTVELRVTWVMPRDPRVATGSLGGLPGRASRSIPGVSAAERPRSTAYPHERVTAVAREHEGEIQSCFTGTLSHRPDVEGTIHVNITLSADGSVTDVVTSSDDLRAPAVTECVLRRVRSWSFPAPSDGIPVVVPHVFSLTRH